MIDFNKCPQRYWSNRARASYMQRYIIVHSIIYYQLSDSIITDGQYDEACALLIRLQNGMGEEYRDTDYYYVFYDFEGITGYYIYDRLINHDREYLTNIAHYVMSGGKKSRK